MEARGYVTSHWEDSEQAREAGRPRRRYYEITMEGSVALETALRRLGLLTAPPHPTAPERA